MKKYYYILTFVSLFISFGNVYTQDDLDLYLLEGANNNPELKSKFSVYLAALERTNIVGKLPDPKVAFAYFIRPVQTRVGPQQFKFSLYQMFPWFGTLDAERSWAAEEAKVKYELFEETKSQLYYDIKLTYYNLYFLYRAIDITQENIDILSILKRIVIIKYEAGKASYVDELRIEIELNDLENQLVDLHENTEVLMVKFNKLLNKESFAEVLTPDSLWQDALPISRDEIIDSILINNNRVKSLENKLSALNFKQTLADKKGMPSFGIGLDYILIGNSDNPIDPALDGADAIVFPKISFNIPIYRKKYNAMVKEVGFEIDAVNEDLNAKRNLLTFLFQKGFKDFTDANRRIVLNTKQEALAQKSLDILIIEYSTDGKDFEEVLRMERKLLIYQLELDKARADLNAAVAFIEFLMGK